MCVTPQSIRSGVKAEWYGDNKFNHLLRLSTQSSQRKVNLLNIELKTRKKPDHISLEQCKPHNLLFTSETSCYSLRSQCFQAQRGD